MYTYSDKLEIIPFEIEEVSTQQLENPWLKFAGVFQDDSDFAEIAKSLIIERYDDDVEIKESLDFDLYEIKVGKTHLILTLTTRNCHINCSDF
ncbi:hypothetical protein PL11201_450081 [Planktothrix sp. PCC 11201]|nr:hypothetical protein PL11201_450081 [Planktothrix sp. PCC 11201]